MPEYWFSIRAIPQVEDEEQRKLCEKIVAPYKPYFMTYVYPSLKAKFNKYLKDNENDAIRKFSKYGFNSIEDLLSYKHKTKKMISFLNYYNPDGKIGVNPCVVNRICWMFENEFSSIPSIYNGNPSFNYTILKSNVDYSKKDYDEIKRLYDDYKSELNSYMQRARQGEIRDDNLAYTKEDFKNKFRMRAQIICPNEQELCDIVLDLCYRSEGTKQFAWSVAGDVIIKNLLKRNGFKLSFPEYGGSEFTYCGKSFTMRTIDFGGDE